MRAALLTLAVAYSTLTVAWAQSAPQLGRVKLGSASLRTGPGDNMPACGTLEQGTIVVVDHPEGADWLAIQPPAGSLSWVNHLYVELRKPVSAPEGSLKFPCDAVVTTEGEIRLAAGVMGEQKPLGVQRTKIPEGTILRVVGPKVRVQNDDSETFWYPITPPRGDFRYLPRASVELIGGGEKPGFVVQASRPGEGSNKTEALPVASIPGPGAGLPATESSRATSEPTHPLWVRARQAERDGNFELAEKLYKDLADEQTRPDGDTRVVNLCYLRIQQLREWKQKKGAEEPKPITDPKLTGAVPAKGTVYGQGILRATTVKIDGQKGYALTSQKGEVWMYVVAQGIELDRYIGRWIELGGSVTYPSNLGGVGLLAAKQIDTVK